MTVQEGEKKLEDADWFSAYVTKVLSGLQQAGTWSKHLPDDQWTVFVVGIKPRTKSIGTGADKQEMNFITMKEWPILTERIRTAFSKAKFGYDYDQVQELSVPIQNLHESVTSRLRKDDCLILASCPHQHMKAVDAQLEN